MLNTDEIRNKEVINIFDGKSLGYVCRHRDKSSGRYH